MLKFYSTKITSDFLLHHFPGQVLRNILETLAYMDITYLEMLLLLEVPHVPVELFWHVRGNLDYVFLVSRDILP